MQQKTEKMGEEPIYYTINCRSREAFGLRGQNLSSSQRKPPVREYIVVVEQACSRLTQGEADELRVEVKKTLKKAQNQVKTSSNITQEEFRALKELKEDRSRMILTTDKGVALVIIDKNDYIQKAEELLNTNTYKKIPEDPTNKQRTNWSTS